MMSWKKRYKKLQEYMEAHIELLNGLEVMEMDDCTKIYTGKDLTSGQIITTKRILDVSKAMEKM